MAIALHLAVPNVLAEIFRALKRDVLASYRPELHYMRGPGPKWREKHEAYAPANAARSRRSPGLQHATDVHAAAY